MYTIEPGVQTGVGYVRPEEDLPATKDGVVGAAEDGIVVNQRRFSVLAKGAYNQVIACRTAVTDVQGGAYS